MARRQEITSSAIAAAGSANGIAANFDPIGTIFTP
jgi:hypothetical protein